MQLPLAGASGLPIIVWHGLGDFCQNPISMVPFVEFVANVTGSTVTCLQIGSTMEEDAENGWLMNVNDQVAYACDLVTNKIGNLTSGFYALGLSQGGLFLRGLLQRCPAAASMRRLVSIGGPQQGVESIPQCDSNTTLCQWVADLLDYFPIYTPIAQEFIAPCDYWHDSVNVNEYLTYSSFLADINNAKPSKNATYKGRVASLEHFVMVQFLQDSVVYPFQSEWFGFYADGSNTQLQTLQQSPIYTQDWLGLKTLDQRGALSFFEVDANHLQFTHQFFIDNLRQFLI